MIENENFLFLFVSTLERKTQIPDILKLITKLLSP